MLRQGTLNDPVSPERVEDDEDEPESEEEAGGEVLGCRWSSQLGAAKHGELPPRHDEKEAQEGGDGVEQHLQVPQYQPGPLSLVEECRGLALIGRRCCRRQLSYAIKNQLVASKAPY